MLFITTKLILFALMASMSLAQETENGVWISEPIKNQFCFYDQGYTWMYIRAYTSTGTIDKSARQNLIDTQPYLANRRLYINPTMKVAPENIIGKICSDVIKGLNEKFHVYVAVYADTNTWTNDKAKNRAFMEKLRESMEKQPECYRTINVISRKFDWEKVFGEDYTEFSKRILIWDKTSGKGCSRDDFVPFGGWVKPDGIVFNHNVKVCENTCDVNCLFMSPMLSDN